MLLDTSTLITVASCVTGLLGVLLLVMWVRERSARGLAWWAAAYLLGGSAVALWGGGQAQGLWAELPDALLFTACGMIWNGARLIHGLPVRPVGLLAGAGVWLVASRFPALAQWGDGRIILSSLIVATYAFLTAYELQRERRRALRRRFALLAPLLHGMVFLTPIALTLLKPPEASADGWFAVVALQTLLYVVGAAFIVLVVANERTTAQYKSAAMTDPLTGICNRRAFAAAAQALIAQRARQQQPVSVLACDLDHFKSINDRFGHAVGDDALRLFAATASARIRASDVIGRLGGEEFAVIVAGGLPEATIVAERIRSAFEQAGVEISGHRANATVSIGIATAFAPQAELEVLLTRADAALYRAKSSGRNRVMSDQEPPPPPPTAIAAAA